jgi:hypothetical protein
LQAEDDRVSAITLDAPWVGQKFAPPTALDIATIELAIVTRLRSAITTVEVGHFPDDPEAYRLTHRIGAALVRYEGGKYGPLLDTAAVVQERRLEFAITLMMRDLGWSFGGAADGPSPGAYAMLEAVRATLTGFVVPGCGKTFPVRERFVKRDKQGGVWIYALVFALTTVSVEASTADNFPLFIRGVAQEQGGLTVISIAAAPYTFNLNDQVQLPNGNVSAIAVTNFASNAPYSGGIDYTIDSVNGILTRIASGALPAGATVNIAFSYAETVIAQ